MTFLARLIATIIPTLIFVSMLIFGLQQLLPGGRTELVLSRLTDAVLACPLLILAIALAAFLGPSLTNAMIAIGVSATPAFA